MDWLWVSPSLASQTRWRAGRQMDLEEVWLEGIWQKVVHVMGALHAVEIPEYFKHRLGQGKDRTGKLQAQIFFWD